jgi:hypothetical protein
LVDWIMIQLGYQNSWIDGSVDAWSKSH